jgi:hypothetical protein
VKYKWTLAETNPEYQVLYSFARCKQASLLTSCRRCVLLIVPWNGYFQVLWKQNVFCRIVTNFLRENTLRDSKQPQRFVCHNAVASSNRLQWKPERKQSAFSISFFVTLFYPKMYFFVVCCLKRVMNICILSLSNSYKPAFKCEFTSPI